MEIYLTPTPQGLIPLHDSDHELFKKLRPGRPYRCQLSQPRNYKFHKKFFALVKLTFDNLPESLAARWRIHTAEDMLRRFKRDLGYFSASVNEYGEREVEYLSISFAAMDQHEFERFYQGAVELVLHSYLRGIGEGDLAEAVADFL